MMPSVAEMRIFCIWIGINKLVSKTGKSDQIRPVFSED